VLYQRVRLIPFILVLALIALVPTASRAQDATPSASPAGSGGTVVAAGLTNPRGFIWGPDGALYVALAGSGGSGVAEQSPSGDIIGPFTGGPTGAVAKIENGCPVAVVTGLPSTINPTGEALGAEDVAFLGDQLYIAVDGGGPAHGNPDLPSGVYKANSDGTATVVADLSAFLRANQTSFIPPDYDPDADGYRMIADEAAGLLWVLEPNVGGLLSVTPDGTITRVADLSEGHPVPSAMVAAPEGGVYIGNLTGVPFPDGAAKVIHVATDGTVTDVWTGLTTVTGLAVGPDGTLYAAELSTGNLTAPPFLQPGSGKIVRQTGAATNEEVATGLMFPIALSFGADGGLYFSTPAIGAHMGNGMIVRLDTGNGTPIATDGTAPTCTPIEETLAPAATGSPEASA
jgi:hypothetical protein